MLNSTFGALCGSLVGCVWMGICLISSLIKKDWECVKIYGSLYLLSNAFVTITFLGCCYLMFG